MHAALKLQNLYIKLKIDEYEAEFDDHELRFTFSLQHPS